MASIAIDCIKHPDKHSVWSPELRRYICPDSEEGKALLVEARSRPVSDKKRREAARHLPINPQFKLVFLTAAAGTLLFAILCVTLTFIIGKEPKPLFEKIVTSMFDLTKIGFGAIVGLLGGKSLHGQADNSRTAQETA